MNFCTQSTSMLYNDPLLSISVLSRPFYFTLRSFAIDLSTQLTVLCYFTILCYRSQYSVDHSILLYDPLLSISVLSWPFYVIYRSFAIDFCTQLTVLCYTSILYYRFLYTFDRSMLYNDPLLSISVHSRPFSFTLRSFVIDLSTQSTILFYLTIICYR